MKSIILTILFIIANMSFSQSLSEKKEKSELVKFMQILPRFLEVAESNSELTKQIDFRLPANFSLTIPDTGQTTFSIDLAVGINILDPCIIGDSLQRYLKFLGSSHLLKIFPIVEYHKNTSISRKQDILKLGGFVSYYNNSLFERITMAFRLSNFINDSRNYQDNKWAFQNGLYFTFDFDNKNRFLKFILPQSTYSQLIKDNNVIEYFYRPSIGIEISKVYKANDELDKGYTDAVAYKLEAGLSFFAKLLNLLIDFQWRHNFIDQTLKTNSNFNYKKYSLSLDLSQIAELNDYRFQIGVDHISGENPWIQLKNQKYYLFAFKLKF